MTEQETREAVKVIDKVCEATFTVRELRTTPTYTGIETFNKSSDAVKLLKKMRKAKRKGCTYAIETTTWDRFTIKNQFTEEYK